MERIHDPKYYFAGFFIEDHKFRVLGKLAYDISERCKKLNIYSQPMLQEGYEITEQLNEANSSRLFPFNNQTVDKFFKIWHIQFDLIFDPPEDKSSKPHLFSTSFTSLRIGLNRMIEHLPKPIKDPSRNRLPSSNYKKMPPFILSSNVISNHPDKIYNPSA